MQKSVLACLVALAVTAVLSPGSARALEMHDKKADVKLTAAPGVKTSAKGNATFVLGKDGNTLHYKLHLEETENVTMAHVHAVGEGGKLGAIIVWLYPPTGEKPSTKAGKFSGTLAEGDITSDRLGGAWKGKPLNAVFEEIEHGKAGVAVHTVKNPGVELWGVHKETMPGKEMPGQIKGY